MTGTVETGEVQDYVDAGGLRTYYEAHGTGDPVVLLHGGFCTVETFGDLTPTLAERYRVYLPERRGHGRTPDVDGPITFDAMALDTIAFMEAVGLSSAHHVGWSDGAVIGLLVALRRPDLVKKLVFIGQHINPEGIAPWVRQMSENMSPEMLPPMLREAYEAVSPDGPEHFSVVFEKLAQLYRTEPNLPMSELHAVKAPTLVMVGDDDIATVEHAAGVYHALPESQLAVVPGTSHALPWEKPALVGRLILDFLAAEQVPKMMGSQGRSVGLRGPQIQPTEVIPPNPNSAE